MNRTRWFKMLLTVSVLVSCCALAVAAPPETSADTTEVSWLHPYVPIVYIVFMIVFILLFLRTTGWVDHDGQRLKLPTEEWNLGFIILIGVQPLLFFAMPAFAALPLGLIGYGVLLNRYVHVRNAKVLDRDKVFTRSHLAVVGRQFLIKMGVKIGPKSDQLMAVAKDHVPVTLLDADGALVSAPTERLEKESPRLALKDLLANAAENRVREIHFIPAGATYRIRYCIDSALHEAAPLPTPLVGELLAEAKALVAGAPKTPEGDPPAFSAFLPLSKQERRVSLMESKAEGVAHPAMRLTNPAVKPPALDKLGMDADMLKKWHEIIDVNSGTVVFAGPSGSGRRTTMYAILGSMDAFTRNIAILEFERSVRRIDNIHQNRPTDYPDKSTVEILTGMFRQDYNVVMLDSVPDRDTAILCMEQSLQEHLILLGLSASDVTVTLGGLLKLGADPKTLSKALRAVVSQRLVRVLCPKCRRPYRPNAEMLAKMGLAGKGEIVFYEEGGCDACFKTGFAGRTALFEFLPITPPVGERIAKGAPLAEVMNVARENSYVSLQRSGLLKVIAGVTSLKEVSRVIKA